MNKIIRNSLSSIILLVLAACTLPAPGVTPTVATPVVSLSVQTQNGVNIFSQVGEIITYNYIVTNAGNTPLAGPATVTDAPRQVACPDVSTVGNLDNNLDPTESITCTASYGITEADMNTGSVMNLAIATIGGATSNQAGITITRAVSTPQPSSVLTLTKTASSQTYGQVGQTITYTYVITNVGTEPLGPDQFTINDNKLSAPLSCGPAGTTIAPNQPLNCSSPYLITEADMGLPNLTNTATASGAGHVSAPVTTTITNLTAPAPETPIVTATLFPPSNLAPGSTIQHQVAVGEWLIQIGRCYGATFSELRNANPQIADPNLILPSMMITVPRIGSVGRIYGPPCITFHTVQSGDTWESIAQRYNADLAVLRRANPAGLVVGRPAKIPLNSAGSVPVTAVPGATATPITPTAPTTAQRITFDPGQTTAARIGVVNPNQSVEYVLSAAQGQELTIRLTAPANEVALGVNGPTGIALKPLDTNPIWTTIITTSGDHFITIASIAGTSSKSYTLEVSLTTPAAVTDTPTATATATPTSTDTPGP